MQPKNVFAGQYLDRMAHLRQNPAWMEEARADPASRVAPVWNSRNLIVDADPVRAALVELAALPAQSRVPDNLILLGKFGEGFVFGAEIESLEAPILAPGTRFEDLRAIASTLSVAEAGLLAYARAMVSWRRRHRFCGSCGSPTLSARSGHAVVCLNAACRIEHFPRIDPAIIVLVSDGDRALLGRQASWPPRRFSTIAGFVEPGESLEDAVSREVLEETGIVVGSLQYQSSQPWPFPASLMLGFSAHAASTEIKRRDNELEDARWFSRQELAAGLALLPPRQSISFRLIEQWFDAGSSVPLRDIQGTEPWPQSQSR
jgi:NAD+ diphosphatase